MVGVRLRYSKDTLYVIGDFWEIVGRLKANQARFRFRSRRWRWPDSLDALERAMQPYPVLPVSFSEAQVLQLAYDRVYIKPTQEWVAAHAQLAQLSVEWWEAVRFKRKENPKSRKAFETYREQVALALTITGVPPEELEREHITALQQTRRTVEKYEARITKWAAERTKERRRETLLARFEDEMGLSRENLAEVEALKGASRQALYEELAGLDWMPHEISELKAVAKHLLKEQRKAGITL
jgi:hypothetical protein